MQKKKKENLTKAKASLGHGTLNYPMDNRALPLFSENLGIIDIGHRVLALG